MEEVPEDDLRASVLEKMVASISNMLEQEKNNEGGNEGEGSWPARHIMSLIETANNPLSQRVSSEEEEDLPEIQNTEIEENELEGFRNMRAQKHAPDMTQSVTVMFTGGPGSE